jgi:hypothetical protein
MKLCLAKLQVDKAEHTLADLDTVVMDRFLGLMIKSYQWSSRSVGAASLYGEMVGVS